MPRVDTAGQSPTILHPNSWASQGSPLQFISLMLNSTVMDFEAIAQRAIALRSNRDDERFEIARVIGQHLGAAICDQDGIGMPETAQLRDV